MSEETKTTVLRLITAASLVVIAGVALVGSRWLMEYTAKPIRVDIEPKPQIVNPENDFAGLWAFTQDCSKFGIGEKHHGLGDFAIVRNLEGDFSLNVSLAFGDNKGTNVTGWNDTKNLKYCEKGGVPSPICEPGERTIGPFHCNLVRNVKSDFIAGEAEIDGHDHDIFIYLVYNPVDGSTTPVMTYEDQSYTELHRGVLH